MRRVVVWISGRGRAANGMVYGSREDGGDPCSVRVTRSHAMLATRALCRLEARVIAILAKTHIVESWASKGSCPQIACFSTKQERDYELEFPVVRGIGQIIFEQRLSTKLVTE